MSRCYDIPFCIVLMLAFAVKTTAQESWIKWECDSTDRHHRFYRADLGVVCWDGKTFSKDNGGIPQYMLDYFEENRRKVQQKVAEMNKNIAELKAARAANPQAQRPLTPPAKSAATVAPAESAPIVPVKSDLFAAIDIGMARSAVLDKLGKPAGSITIPGEDGFVEIWTYQLTDGSTAKVRIEKDVVTSREPKKEEHER